MDYTVSLQVQHQLAVFPTHFYQGYSVELQVRPPSTRAHARTRVHTRAGERVGLGVDACAAAAAAAAAGKSMVVVLHADFLFFWWSLRAVGGGLGLWG